VRTPSLFFPPGSPRRYRIAIDPYVVGVRGLLGSLPRSLAQRWSAGSAQAFFALYSALLWPIFGDWPALLFLHSPPRRSGRHRAVCPAGTFQRNPHYGDAHFYLARREPRTSRGRSRGTPAPHTEPISVVGAIADRTLRTSKTFDDFRATFQDRLGALGRAPGSSLTHKEGGRVTFDELISSELAAQCVRVRENASVT